MKTIEPRRVQISDTFVWVKEALELISRRFPAFLLSIALFILPVYASVAAVSSFARLVPAPAAVAILLVFCSFILLFIMADMVVVAFLSDNSRSAKLSERMSALLPEQKILFKLSFMAFLVGSSIWVVSLTINPNKDFFVACQQVVDMMMAEKDMPVLFVTKLTAGILYFLVIALYGLRTFFSLPLVIFHQMEYKEAKALSHRALYINIQPMSVALAMWVILFMLSLTVLSILALVLFPLFAAFIYVSYRHIFMGQLENEPGRAVVSVESTRQHVTIESK